jgi:RNA polymerase sigma factor (sigma-70 family)
MTDPRRLRFSALYREHVAAVSGYALRRVGPDDAADVVTETFIVVWNRLESVPDHPADRLWLYATARRVLANERRARQRRDALVQRLADEFRTALAVTRAPSEDALVAADAFGRLGARDREVLGLAGWEGLSAAEMAEVLGCSINAARLSLHRARRRYDHLLAEAGLPSGRPVPEPERTPAAGDLRVGWAR